MNDQAKALAQFLNLQPHPTCGLVKQTYLSQTILPKEVLPTTFGSDRPLGSVLLFMVTQETQIKLHRIHSDQMYHFYMGAPLEVLLLYPNGQAEIKQMGNDLKGGMHLQLFIPADTFHMSRLPKNAEFALLGTSEWIGVEPKDVELGEVDKLISAYPFFKQEILDFTNEG